MKSYFNKLSSLGFAFIASLGITHAQHDQFVEIKFTPNGSTETEITKYVDEKAESFDLTNYINQNLDQGEIVIDGILSSDLNYTRIKFDSKKVSDQDATFCESVRTEVKPFLGVASSGMEDFSGVLLERIINKSAADQAAFQTGDVISYIDDYEIRSVCDLMITVKKLEVGQQVMVTYDDGNSQDKKLVTVGSREYKHITWTACTNTPNAEELQTVAVSDLSEHAYELYPNPSIGLSTITFEHTGKGDLMVEIFDLQGKRIFEQDNIDFDHYYQDQVDLTNQPSGLYLVELTLNGESFTKELVVKRQ